MYKYHMVLGLDEDSFHLLIIKLPSPLTQLGKKITQIICGPPASSDLRLVKIPVTQKFAEFYDKRFAADMLNENRSS